MPPRPLLPLSIGNALDLAFRICIRRRVPLVKAVFFIVAPLALVTSVVEVWVIPESLLSPDGTNDAREVYDELRSALGGVALITLIGALGGLFASAACFRIIAAACLGREADWIESVRYALERLPSILWVSILGGAAIAVGLLLCVLPGLWVAVLFSLAVPAVLAEGVRGRRALGRSRALVRGRFWPVVGVLLLGSLVAGAISVAIASVGGAVDPATPTGFVVSWATQTVGNTLATPIVAAVTTVLYLELRARKEQLTLDELGSEIGVTAAETVMWPVGRDTVEPVPAPGVASADVPGDAPPYWPPPPGWRPAASPQPDDDSSAEAAGDDAEGDPEDDPPGSR